MDGMMADMTAAWSVVEMADSMALQWAVLMVDEMV
jgi:hypothetical protein